MTTSRTTIGVGLVLAGAALFTVNAGVARVAIRAGVEPATLTSIRVTMTFVALVVIAALFRRSALRPPPLRLIGVFAAHGVAGVALLNWTYFNAIDRLPIGMALLLEFQAPILVALWALLVQHQPVHRRIWLGLLLAMVGLAAATEAWQGATFDSWGILAGLGAAVCLASYFLIGEHLLGAASLDPLQVILWAFGFAALAINIFVPLTTFTQPLGTSVSLLGALEQYSVPLWMVLGFIIALGTLVPFFVELWALVFINATTATTIAILEPIGVAALGWVWFGESLGPVAVVGCLTVIIGILVAQSARQQAAVEPPPLH